MITVLLAENMTLMRGALTGLLNAEADLEVVSALSCDSAMVIMALRLRPDVVVADVDTPFEQSMIAVEGLLRWAPRLPVVAMTATSSAPIVRRVLAAGVMGAIDRNTPATRLIETIRLAARSQRCVDLSLEAAALPARPNPLSRQEMRVLRLAADGASGPEIAERMHLSRGTVRNYLSKVIIKTDARRRVDAVRIAREAGWL